MRKAPTPDQIDALLPQTQCGLCGHGGCMPYAEAMVYDDAPIHLCPPGGIPVLRELGLALNKDPLPYMGEMERAYTPPQIVAIRESECIGCTKCIQACPVDAVLGAAKLMHAIITDECTGCELCIPACPVDCIDLISLSNPKSTSYHADKNLKVRARDRYNKKNQRVSAEKAELQAKVQKNSEVKRTSYIQAAIARAKAKKSIT